MKTPSSNLNLVSIVGLLAFLILVATAVGPVSGALAAPGAAITAPADEVTSGEAAGQLSDTEIEGLLYMREEEKLARDVYLTLYEAWGVPIFQNIARSEAAHMAAVGTLIDRYGLADPATGDIGVFTDPTLQALYDQLVAEGRQSLANALRVGAAIEEIDILDLQERLAQTDRADIALVYENLMKGSRNHLRAFASTLARQTGETYQPQYLDRDSYESIVNAGRETGGRGQGQGQGRGQGRRGNR
jgi:hypothetical protein